MDMLTPVQERLRGATEAEMEKIAAASDVPIGTIARIKYGQTPNPRVLTVQKLYAHLFPSDQSQH